MEQTSRDAARRYETQEIETADPLRRIVRVYELACLHGRRARAALQRGDAAAKGRAVHRLSRCLGLLREVLDFKRGGEVARQLDRVYEYLQFRLAQAHLRNDAAAFEEILAHLTSLAQAWQEAASRPAGLERTR